MASTQDLRNILNEFQQTPDSRGLDLRLDLAEIVLRHLSNVGMTQKEFAEIAGMKAAFINRVIHSDQNWTSDVAGRILFALGVKVKLVEVQNDSAVGGIPMSQTSSTITISQTGVHHGKDNKKNEGEGSYETKRGGTHEIITGRLAVG
jgi:ribosome-binding protein aMBF1 (putative translation factor)